MRGKAVLVCGLVVALALIGFSGLRALREHPDGQVQTKGRFVAAHRGGHRVPTTFPTVQHRPFRSPVEIRSHHGVLRTTFTAKPTTFTVAGARIRGYAFQGRFMGPTLRVRPGDTIRIRVRDRLGQPTNLHTHGMYVSPIGVSDNVLRVMKPGSSNRVVIKLPRNIEPGTYWYHTHLHGLTEKQVFAGLSGVLIVEGLTDRLPDQLRGIPQHVVALKDLQVHNGAIVTSNIDSDAPTTRTVNGQVDPVLSVRTNQTQLLRLANIGADIWYRLHLTGAWFRVIAEDSNPVARVWVANQLVLPPGKRFDVLVRWPRPGAYALRTLRYSTGPAGDDYPARRLMTVRVKGPAVPVQAWPRSLGPASPLATDHVARTRHLVFSENTKTNQFFIDGKQFDAKHINIVAKLGTTEQWIIRNTSAEEHPFHIHVNDFLVMSVNGKPYHARSEQDVVPLPAHGTVRIRMHFSRFVGLTVFHCHILAHEDHGMMGIIDITRTGRASPAALATLHRMYDEMASAHTMDMGDTTNNMPDGSMK